MQRLLRDEASGRASGHRRERAARSGLSQAEHAGACRVGKGPQKLIELYMQCACWRPQGRYGKAVCSRWPGTVTQALGRKRPLVSGADLVMSSSQGGEQGHPAPIMTAVIIYCQNYPARATPCQCPGPIMPSCLATAESATVSDIPVSVRD